MPITADDIEYRLSGGAANSDQALSLGGGISDTVIESGTVGNLFDDVTSEEAKNGAVEHRAFYVRNRHDTLTWVQVAHWIEDRGSVPAGVLFDVGLALEDVNVPIVQALSVPSDPPDGVVFTRPVAKTDGLLIGDIPAGQFKGLWIRRTVAAGTRDSLGAIRLRCEGTSAS